MDRRPALRRLARPIWVAQLPIQALWTALIVVFLWFILNRHRFGEHVLFIGDSNAVSRVVGIDVEREKIKLFTLMGGLAAIAAIMLTLENKNYFGNQGQGYLLTAIASVLIGGTSIFGGRATIIGTVFGCFIIGMIEAGLVATGLTGAWVSTVQGLIFLIAIIFYLYVDEPQRRQRLLRAPAAVARHSAARVGRMSGAGAVRRERARVSKGRNDMTSTKTLLAGAAAPSLLAGARLPPQPIGEGSSCTCRWAAMPATAPRSPARPARRRPPRRFGVDLKEQFSAWAPETMINQFKEAVAAKPDLHRDHGPSRQRRLPATSSRAPSTRASSSPSAIRR